MHGVGFPFFTEAMKVFGFAPFITVAEQVVVALPIGSSFAFSTLTLLDGQQEEHLPCKKLSDEVLA